MTFLQPIGKGSLTFLLIGWDATFRGQTRLHHSPDKTDTFLLDPGYAGISPRRPPRCE